MTTEEQLVESHVQEYNARLKRIDELIGRADNVENPNPEDVAELSKLKKERNKLANQLLDIKALSAAEWAKEGGPMVIWDLVAERLEKLVERLE
ncbi:MAG TPA: hypothetical protein ENI97_05735 [Gammaproteobacteria bacterium]|nr:hypothetical protein [Gammaproteobacteria bacterium]